MHFNLKPQHVTALICCCWCLSNFHSFALLLLPKLYCDDARFIPCVCTELSMYNIVHTQRGYTKCSNIENTAVPNVMSLLQRRFSPWHHKSPKIAFYFSIHFVFVQISVFIEKDATMHQEKKLNRIDRKKHFGIKRISKIFLIVKMGSNC